MDLIKRIKSIFKTEEKQIEIKKSIKIEEIDQYLNNKETELISSLKFKSDPFHHKITEIIDNLEEDIEILSKVDVNKSKADERIKKITDLGRNEYISHLNNLIKKIKNKKPIEDIQNEIENFAESSGKSHFKATQLIGKEIERISNNIIKLKSLSISFLKDNSQLITNKSKLDQFKVKNKQRKNNIKEKEKISKEINSINQSIEKSEYGLKKAIAQINNIKKGTEYNKKLNLENKIKENEIFLEELEFQIKTLIDNRILEKYIHNNPEKTNKKYIQDFTGKPIQTLLSDDKLRIYIITQEIIEKIRNEEIILKDSEKIIKKINIEKETFMSYKENLINLNKKIDDLDKELKEIDIPLSDILQEKIILVSSIDQRKKQLIPLEKKQNKLEETIKNINEELTKGFLY